MLTSLSQGGVAMKNSKQWELEFDELLSGGIYVLPPYVDKVWGINKKGEYKYAGHALNKEDIKNLISSTINQAVEESLSDMEVKMKGWHGHGDEMVRDYRNKLSIIKDKNEVVQEEENK